MGKEAKFALLEIPTCEELKGYNTLEDAFDDLQWKCPTSFWVGGVEERTVYSITQFYEKYAEELEEFNKKKDN